MHHFCPTCKKKFDDSFCSNCGEKKIEPKDLFISVLIYEFVSWIFEIDKKFWRTLYFLFFKPGKLVNMYMQGSRISTYSPLKIFIVSNLLFYFIFYFLFGNITVFFTTSTSMINADGPISINNILHLPIGKWAKYLSHSNGVNFTTFLNAVDNSAENISKSFIFILVIVFANIIYWLTQGRKDFYLKAHVLSLNFVSLFMLFCILFLGPVIYIHDYVSSKNLIIFYFILSTYLIFTIYNTYSYSKTKSLTIGLTLIGSFYFLINIYKQLVVVLSMYIYPFNDIWDFLKFNISKLAS
jgi:hypothetical protein